MKKIIFLSTQSLNKRNYQRFGMKILKKNFFIEYWDLSFLNKAKSITKTDLDLKKKKIKNIIFNSFFSIIKKIYKINSSFYLIDFSSLSGLWVLIIKKFLTIKGAIKIYVSVGNTVESEKYIKKQKMFLLKKIMYKNFIYNFLSFKVKKILKIFFFENYQFFFIGGKIEKKLLNIKNNYTYSHNLDYNIFLNLKYSRRKKKNYIVFLDQNLPNHSDYKILKIPNYINQNYYKNLKNFINKAEKIFKQKIIFCVHPRSSKNDKYLKYFNNLRFNNTAEYIKNSSMVIGHDSLALNFAVLWKKPILLLTVPGMEFSNKLQNIKYFSKLIKCNIYDIDGSNLKQLKKNLKINHKKYNNFIKHYIKYKGEEKNSWEIFSKKINEN